MSKSALQIANELTAAAERARLAGDPAASIELACKAAEYVQLAKLLGNAIKEASPPPSHL